MDIGMDGGLRKSETPRHLRKANPERNVPFPRSHEPAVRIAVRTLDTSTPDVERISTRADAMGRQGEREDEPSVDREETAMQQDAPMRMGGEIVARLSQAEMRAAIAHEAKKISKDVFRQKAGPHGRTDAMFENLFRAADFTERKFSQDLAAVLRAENALEDEDVEFLLNGLVAGCDAAYRRQEGFVAPRESDKVDLSDFFADEKAMEDTWNTFEAGAQEQFTGPPVRVETGVAVMDFFKLKFEALHAAAR